MNPSPTTTTTTTTETTAPFKSPNFEFLKSLVPRIEEGRLVNNDTSNIFAVPCKFYADGACIRGDLCEYTHSIADRPKVTSVCKYFLNGMCYVTNCSFRHSKDTIVCKFWLRSQCFNQECNYSHNMAPSILPISSLSIAEQADEQQPPPQRKQQPTESDFPSLTTKGPKKAVAAAAPKPPSNNNSNNTPTYFNNMRIKTKKTTATKTTTTTESFQTTPTKVPKAATATMDMLYSIKFGSLKDIFKHVKVEHIMTELTRNNQDLEKTKESLTARFGAPKEPVLPGLAQGGGNSNNNYNVTSPTTFANQLQYGQDIGWSETGTAVSQLFSTHRDEAIKHAEARNKYFQMAAMSYVNGDSESAKKYSFEGYKHDKIMKELHQRARDAIFQQRNMNLESNILDLHGLHVKEAIDILSSRLGVVDPLYLIIGTGHHSISTVGRLPEAIKRFITDNRYKYSDCSKDRRQGMIMVHK
eukprot:gene11919-13887_t